MNIKNIPAGPSEDCKAPLRFDVVVVVEPIVWVCVVVWNREVVPYWLVVTELTYVYVAVSVATDCEYNVCVIGPEDNVVVLDTVVMTVPAVLVVAGYVIVCDD